MVSAYSSLKIASEVPDDDSTTEQGNWIFIDKDVGYQPVNLIVAQAIRPQLEAGGQQGWLQQEQADPDTSSESREIKKVADGTSGHKDQLCGIRSLELKS